MPALPDNMNAGNLSPYGGHYGQYGGANYEAHNPVSGFIQGLTAGNSIIMGNQADDRAQQQFDQQQEATEQAQQDQTNTRLALAMRTRMLSNPSGWMTEFKPEEIQSVFGNNNANLQNNAEYGHLVDPTQRNNFKQGADIFHASLPNAQNPEFNINGIIDGANKMWSPAMNKFSPDGSQTRIAGVVPAPNFQTDGSFYFNQITDHPDGSSTTHPLTSGGSFTGDPNAPAKPFTVDSVMDHVRTGQALTNYLDHNDMNSAFRAGNAAPLSTGIGAVDLTGNPPTQAPVGGAPVPSALTPARQNAQSPANPLDMVDSKLIQFGEPTAIARSQQIATNNVIVQQARDLDPNLTPEQRQSAIMGIALQNGASVSDATNLATHLGAGANPMDVAGKAAAFVNERIGYLNSPQNAALMAQDLQKMGAPQSMVQQISELSKITDQAQFNAARDQIRTQAQAISTQIEQNTAPTGFAPNGQIWTQPKGAGGMTVGGPSYAAPAINPLYTDRDKTNKEMSGILDDYNISPMQQAAADKIVDTDPKKQAAKRADFIASQVPSMPTYVKARIADLQQHQGYTQAQINSGPQATTGGGSSGGSAGLTAGPAIGQALAQQMGNRPPGKYPVNGATIQWNGPGKGGYYVGAPISTAAPKKPANPQPTPPAQVNPAATQQPQMYHSPGHWGPDGTFIPDSGTALNPSGVTPANVNSIAPPRPIVPYGQQPPA